MTDDTRSSGLRWLMIGGIGCAGIVGLAALAAGTLVALTFRGYERGLEVRAELDRRFGAPDSYRLPPDGAFPADRMRRFLDVRRRLMPRCAEITDIVNAFGDVDTCAKQGAPEAGELFRRIGSAVRRMPSMGIAFGHYVTDRNQALLEAGMGLAEYSFIYAVSYFGVLGQPPTRVLERPEPPRIFEDRVYPEIARVIDRHISDTRAFAGPWVDELSRLREDRERVPFSGPLPAELAASIEPHRAALAAVACPAAAELDLTVTVRRRSFGYDHR